MEAILQTARESGYRQLFATVLRSNMTPPPYSCGSYRGDVTPSVAVRVFMLQFLR